MFRFPSSDTLLIPGLLPNELPGLQSVWPGTSASFPSLTPKAYDPSCVQLSRHFVFDFVPTGLFSRFQVKLMSQRYNAKCWRSGVFLECDGALVLVTLDSELNTVIITARGNETENPIIPFCSIVELLTSAVEHQFQVKPSLKVLPEPSTFSHF